MGPFTIISIKNDIAKVWDPKVGKEKRFHINRLSPGSLQDQFIDFPSQMYPQETRSFIPRPRVRMLPNPFFDPSLEDDDRNPRLIYTGARTRVAAPATPPNYPPPRPPAPALPPRSPAAATSPEKRHTRSDGPVEDLPNVMPRPLEFRHRSNDFQDL